MDSYSFSARTSKAPKLGVRFPKRNWSYLNYVSERLLQLKAYFSTKDYSVFKQKVGKYSL